MYKTKFILINALILCSLADANAQTCSPAPSCAELGYTKLAADCSGKSIIKCPFDKSKVFCEDNVIISCASLGFTDTISECPGAYSVCPNDSSKGKCDFEARVGDLKYSLRTFNHNGWLLCRGASYSSSQYPELYSVIGGIYGTTLPNYSGYFLKGATTPSLSKTPQAAGLPNITGWGGNSASDASPNGAFYLGYPVKQGKNWAETYPSIYFDASRSNSIYGKSNTVTPQNYSVNIFIYSGRQK